MKKILPFAIYLLGCVCSYQVGKYELTKFRSALSKDGYYTVGDRNFNLLISSTSFVGAVGWGIVMAIRGIDNDAPSKW